MRTISIRERRDVSRRAYLKAVQHKRATSATESVMHARKGKLTSNPILNHTVLTCHVNAHVGQPFTERNKFVELQKGRLNRNRK